MYIVLKITVHSKKFRETVLQIALCQIVIKSSAELGSLHLLNSVSVSDLLCRILERGFVMSP